MLRSCLRRSSRFKVKVNVKVKFVVLTKKHDQLWSYSMVVDDLVNLVKKGETKEDAIYASLLRHAVWGQLQTKRQHLDLVVRLYERVCLRVRRLNNLLGVRAKVRVPRCRAGWRQVNPAVGRALCQLVSRIKRDELLRRARRRFVTLAAARAALTAARAVETARAVAKTARAAVLDANDVKTAQAGASLLRLRRRMSCRQMS